MTTVLQLFFFSICKFAVQKKKFFFLSSTDYTANIDQLGFFCFLVNDMIDQNDVRKKWRGERGTGISESKAKWTVFCLVS